MDMARTTVNVVGNCLAAAVVGRWEGELGPLGAPAQPTPALARGAAEPAQRTGT
jgi:proton glutamate symport protein